MSFDKGSFLKIHCLTSKKKPQTLLVINAYIKWNQAIFLITRDGFLEGVSAHTQIIIRSQVTHFDQ